MQIPGLDGHDPKKKTIFIYNLITCEFLFLSFTILEYINIETDMSIKFIKKIICDVLHIHIRAIFQKGYLKCFE